MPIGIIINPISGAGGRHADAARERRARAEHGALALGADVEIAMTSARGHAAELAAGFAARGMDVVAWGGDGTVNEAAGPLIGGPQAIGIVPSGSGDGLARGLGLSLDPSEALVFALGEHARAIDVGIIANRHFLNIAGIGFDAAIATRFNQQGQRGLMGYMRAGLPLIWSYRAPRYRFSLDDGPSVDGARLLIGFANAPTYGNGLVLDADADACDGWLDVVVADAGPWWRQLWRARRLSIGLRKPAEGVHRARARTARVSGERLVCHVDGETFETSGEIEVRIRPGALRVKGLNRPPSAG
jgi:diacylglycerol kinase (ATP)